MQLQTHKADTGREILRNSPNSVEVNCPVEAFISIYFSQIETVSLD